MTVKPNYTELLVIGSGLAGAVSAIIAADEGISVTIISKTAQVLGGNTPKAQGGIIYKNSADSANDLKQDIMTAGAGHCWEPAVDQLCKEGPGLIDEFLIKRCGVSFDKNPNGELDLTEEGGHSAPRIIHTKDQTGYGIQVKVTELLKNHPRIQVLTGHTAIDLLTYSHHSNTSTDIYKKPTCFGAIVLENASGKIIPIFANRTILATGGLGQIYLHTTNPEETQGDGIAMGWRAGARCINLQYIQFHPTTLYHESSRFLITESLRGEGARLITHEGKEFMNKFHHQGSLAPRDIVARGIHQTMLDTRQSCVYLDISHKDAAWLKQRFPGIYKVCLDKGCDITRDPIPVVPAAHYSCGGLSVNLVGRTSLNRLYAVGEVSCTGVHGANRLASSSLLEALVWGFRAGKDAADHSGDDVWFPKIDPWYNAEQIIDPALIQQDWQTIKSTMWNYVGLIRTRERLHRAKTILRNLQIDVERFYRNAKLDENIIGLRNGLQAAIALVDATLEARESRGAHYLLDTEKED